MLVKSPDDARLRELITAEGGTVQTVARSVEDKNGEDGMIVTGLPDPGAGHTYQAWYLEGQQAVSAGVFTLGANGVTVVSMAAPGTSVSAVALTIEPAGGSSQPTGQPIAKATLAG